MVRMADWPRNPYLNDELREWVALHLSSLGVEDLAVYAQAAAGQDEERRVLVATSVGLLDSWYAPRGSTARFSLSVRLYPWPAVHGVDLRGETSRLWAHEHQSRWRLRLSRPALDTMADTPELGRALAEFAAACSRMAQPSSSASASAPSPDMDDAVPAFLGRAAKAEAARAPIRVDSADEAPEPAPTPAPAPVATAPVASPPSPAPVAVPASRPASSQSPLQAEDTVMELERRLGLRGPES
jgi:hypothetical protein